MSLSIPAPRIASLLQEHHEALIEQWIQLVLNDPEVPEANRLSEAALRDHIPRLLSRMRDLLAAQYALAANASEAAIQFSISSSAQAHALHRFANGYSLAHAMREMTHFRAAVVDLCGREGARLEGEEAKLLQAALDKALITVAVEMEQAARLDLEVERERLRQEVEFRERFMGILGHDLRNPLSAIVNAATLLGELDDVPHQRGWVLQQISTSAERMSRMIGDLLDMTRIRTGGRLTVRPQPADFSAICAQVTREHEMVYRDRAILLRSSGDTSGAWDADRITQLVQNLVGNALDYSPADTAVRIAVRRRGEAVWCLVHNRGPAIPAEKLRLIFEPFQRAGEEARETDGLGLGLFIAAEIAAAHGGSLRVRSGPLQGTTFIAALPRFAKSAALTE